MSCKQCIRESQIGRSLTHHPVQNPNELSITPEDTMQIDLVPELSPSVG